MKPSIGKGITVYKENKRDFFRASKENEIDEMEAFKIASCFFSSSRSDLSKERSVFKKIEGRAKKSSLFIRDCFFEYMVKFSLVVTNIGIILQNSKQS